MVFGQAMFDGGSRQRVYKEAGISRRAPGDSGKDTKIFFGNLPSFAKSAKDIEYGVNLFFGNLRVSANGCRSFAGQGINVRHNPDNR